MEGTAGAGMYLLAHHQMQTRDSICRRWATVVAEWVWGASPVHPGGLWLALGDKAVILHVVLASSSFRCFEDLNNLPEFPACDRCGEGIAHPSWLPHFVTVISWSLIDKWGFLLIFRVIREKEPSFSGSSISVPCLPLLILYILPSFSTYETACLDFSKLECVTIEIIIKHPFFVILKGRRKRHVLLLYSCC